MIFSIKAFLPRYNDDGVLDKVQAMKACSMNFNSINDTSKWSEHFDEIKSLLQNYCVYSNIRWKNNHRNKFNAIKNIDMLIFDIDDGLTIENVLAEIPLKIMLVTTTSHTPEKHKFRVLIPLESKIEFESNDEYKELMKLIDKKYFNGQADAKCFEMGRGYISTPDANVYFNDKNELLDCKMYLEDVKTNLTIQEEKRKYTLKHSELFNDYKKTKSIEEVKKSFQIKRLVQTCRKGNNYEPVFKILCEAKKQGLSDEDAVRLVLSYNFGAEYSDYDSLMTKVKRCA